MSLDLAVYLVTDAAQCAARGRTVAETAGLAAQGGASVVQLRDKVAGPRELLRTLEEVAAAVPDHVAVLLDDRVDVFLAARARGVRVDGVHVGQSDLDPADVRALVGPDPVVGVTAGSPRELRAVGSSRVRIDYVGIGAVRPTRTKPDAPAAVGVEGFAHLAAIAPVPAVAIGGVTVRDVAALRAAGASGTAVVSAVCAADDPRAAAEELRAAWLAAAPVGGAP